MTSLCSIEEVVEEARQGRMFILVDAEERENEGDLVIPAQHCDAAAVNFMATHGRGLICLALTARRVRELGLPKMARRNLSRHKTAFTVSIEAREGVASGISAHDRAHTIATAIDRNKGGADIVSPGHVFPLIGRVGGVLARAGHTEAAIDIAREVPAEISAGDAGDWLEDALAQPAPDRTRVVFHTVAWQYFPEATKARALAAMERHDGPLVRFSMEADGGRGARLTLTHYPSGEVQELGRADFHGRWVEWLG